MTPLVHAIVDALPTATMVLNRTGSVRAANAPAIALLGTDPDLSTARDLVLQGEVPAVWSSECVDADGEKRWVLYRLTALDLDGLDRAVVLTAVDVTWERAAERELETLRTIDVVTGLPNARQLDSYLARALERHRRHPDRLAALHIELTGLDHVASDHGLGQVDELMVDVAGRLHLAVRTGDFVARTGPAAFAVLVERERAGAASADRRGKGRGSVDIEIAATRIATMLCEPYDLETTSVEVGVDTRLAVATAEDDVSTLLDRAESDAYRTERNSRRAHLRLTT